MNENGRKKKIYVYRKKEREEREIDRFVISSFPVVQTWPFDTLYVPGRGPIYFHRKQQHCRPPLPGNIYKFITRPVEMHPQRGYEQSRELFITLDSRELRFLDSLAIWECLFIIFLRMEYYLLLILLDNTFWIPRLPLFHLYRSEGN